MNIADLYSPARTYIEISVFSKPHFAEFLLTLRIDSVIFKIDVTEVVCQIEFVPLMSG